MNAITNEIKIIFNASSFIFSRIQFMCKIKFHKHMQHILLDYKHLFIYSKCFLNLFFIIMK